jgi:hypothetical protein
MNTDDSRFDRLVDDELSEAERRQLLAGLDNEPGGWRRCTLAFLESQCWKQTFDGRSRHTPCADIEIASTRFPTRLPAHGVFGLYSRRLGTLLAMAACFLAVFWVGTQMRRAGQVAGTVDMARLAPASTPDMQQPNPWRTVTVATPAGSSLSIPAVERDNIDPQWLRRVPPAMPDDVMRAFVRAGHQIEQHRELVPVPLKDGRQLVVPVDQVDVHYVGNNETY